MTAQLSRERLEALANIQSLECMALPASHAESAQMARMLLAGMDSEPVYQYWCYTTVENSEGDQEDFWFWNDCDKDFFDKIDGKKRMLYAAPPAPVAVTKKSNTDYFDTLALDTAREIMCDVNRRADFLGGDIQLLSRIQCRIDDACRAAMLKGENHEQ